MNSRKVPGKTKEKSGGLGANTRKKKRTPASDYPNDFWHMFFSCVLISQGVSNNKYLPEKGGDESQPLTASGLFCR